MNKAKLNIPMFAALILLLLTMITTHMTSGLYARYTAQASGSDSARVAKFAVSSTVTANEDKTDEYTHTLVVHNGSEVAVEYSVEVVMDEHLSVTIGEETKTLTGEETSVTFTDDSWKLAPGANSNGIGMKLAISDWSGLTDPNEDKNKEEHVTLGFTVNIIAVQMD